MRLLSLPLLLLPHFLPMMMMPFNTIPIPYRVNLLFCNPSNHFPLIRQRLTP